MRVGSGQHDGELVLDLFHDGGGSRAGHHRRGGGADTELLFHGLHQVGGLEDGHARDQVQDLGGVFAQIAHVCRSPCRTEPAVPGLSGFFGTRRPFRRGAPLSRLGPAVRRPSASPRRRWRGNASGNRDTHAKPFRFGRKKWLADHAEHFKREAKAASLINHPNAITIFDFGEDEGILYLAMEYLAGETLRQRLRREPAFTIDQALDAFESMAGALGAAHKVGVVHRDLKPDNIFIAKFDAAGEVVKVLDFGLAKLLDPGTSAPEDQLTRPELRLGTPRYMAPEQALGIQPIDSRCDVYALGLLLFEMLAGRAPFTGEDGMEVLAQRLRKESPKLSAIAPNKNFSEQMDSLLQRMLERDRAKRPSDANEVLVQVREIRKNGQVYRTDDAEDEDPMTLNDQPATSGHFRRANASAPGRPTGNVGRQTGVGGPASRPPQRGGGMISLDQDDDLADKRTVLVEPGGDMAPGQMMDPQRPMSMSQAPAIGQSSPMLSPYGRPGTASAPGISQSGSISSSFFRFFWLV